MFSPWSIPIEGHDYAKLKMEMLFSLLWVINGGLKIQNTALCGSYYKHLIVYCSNSKIAY